MWLTQSKRERNAHCPTFLLRVSAISMIFLVVVFGFVGNSNTLEAEQQDSVGPKKRLALFESAFNSEKDQPILDFVEQNFAVSGDSDKLQRMQSFFCDLRKQFGPISVNKVQNIQSGSSFIAGHVIAKVESTGQWKNFQFFVDRANQGRFAWVAVADAIEPRQVPQGSLTDPKIQKWLADHVQWLAKTRKLSGTFVVAKKGDKVFSTDCGWENFEERTRISSSSRFNVASGGKMITAICLAQLEEKGLLDFDDLISEYLPIYANVETIQTIRIRHLLTHTSGLPEYWTDEYEKHWDRIDKLDQIIPFFADKPLEFDPGSRHEYCNTNFVVLGLIIESITEKSYFEYVEENVFTPAGMTASGFFDPRNKRTPVARSYGVAFEVEGSEIWELAKLGRRGTSAGGVYLSTDDLLKFDQALIHDRLIQEKTLENLVTGKVAQPVGGKYAYGFMEGEIQGERWYGHGGTGPGSFFQFTHFPESGYTIIMCANHGGTAARDVFQKLRQAVIQTIKAQ